jgi:hypothetical protein
LHDSPSARLCIEGDYGGTKLAHAPTAPSSVLPTSIKRLLGCIAWARPCWSDGVALARPLDVARKPAAAGNHSVGAMRTEYVFIFGLCMALPAMAVGQLLLQ